MQYQHAALANHTPCRARKGDSKFWSLRASDAHTKPFTLTITLTITLTPHPSPTSTLALTLTFALALALEPPLSHCTYTLFTPCVHRIGLHSHHARAAMLTMFTNPGVALHSRQVHIKFVRDPQLCA